MARTPIETIQPNNDMTLVQEKNVNELIEAGQQASIAQAAVMDSFDVVKAIGQIEAAAFMRQVADKLAAEIAIKVKESKKYKGLPYKDADGNLRQVADFAEYCEVFLGKSYRRVAELVSNYNQLGPELYEQAERIGFRQRDYNALKALPADDRQLIAQAIEEENLDKALDLMQEMAAKHVREKESLGKQLDALAKDNQSKDDVIKQKIEVNNKKDEEILVLQNELANVRRDLPIYAHIQWPQAFQGYVHQLGVVRKNLKHALGSLEVIRGEAMAIQPESPEEEAALTVAREMLAKELIGVQNEAADILEGLAATFDKSLGLYANERLDLIKRATGMTDEE